MDYEISVDADGNPCLDTALTGYALLSNPMLNKGMAFTEAEREMFHLRGLIPPHQIDLNVQLARSYEAFANKPFDIEKYIYLRDLQDSNETLFYALLTSHIAELMPIVYTPVVGLGCQRYSHIYRRPRGVYLAYHQQDAMDTIFDHPRFDHVKAIVVSDGERILGLGDQGAGGMGIPIGKLALYSACAGIHPSETLPILLDVGTNNADLLADPLYIGWHHERIRGADYDAFIEKFVIAVKKRFPHVLLQWEDFAKINATPILDKYRDELCTFNDDIQGTAAVAAGALFAAVQATGSRLRDQRIVVVGGGSAGCGISQLIMQAIRDEGLSDIEARRHFYVVDKEGLLLDDMPELLPFQRPFAQSQSNTAHWSCTDFNKISLQDVITNVHPTLLIGVSGQPGVFTEDLVKSMAAHVERPIIFPLSNPTARSEASPSDLMRWTEERAIIGTGSPFGPITKGDHEFRVDQTNNCYIFPGLGLGLIAVQSRRVTDAMFMVAAKVLADCSPGKTDPEANLLPSLSDIREVSLRVAIAVANEAIRSGLATIQPDKPLEDYVRQQMWAPCYLPYRKIVK